MTWGGGGCHCRCRHLLVLEPFLKIPLFLLGNGGGGGGQKVKFRALRLKKMYIVPWGKAFFSQFKAVFWRVFHNLMFGALKYRKRSPSTKNELTLKTIIYKLPVNAFRIFRRGEFATSCRVGN